MNNLVKILSILLIMSGSNILAQSARHTFTLGPSEFLLDKEPYQIISGELHPARIPQEYWQAAYPDG